MPDPLYQPGARSQEQPSHALFMSGSTVSGAAKTTPSIFTFPQPQTVSLFELRIESLIVLLATWFQQYVRRYGIF